MRCEGDRTLPLFSENGDSDSASFSSKPLILVIIHSNAVATIKVRDKKEGNQFYGQVSKYASLLGLLIPFRSCLHSMTGNHSHRMRTCVVRPPHLVTLWNRSEIHGKMKLGLLQAKLPVKDIPVGTYVRDFSIFDTKDQSRVVATVKVRDWLCYNTTAFCIWKCKAGRSALNYLKIAMLEEH